MKIHSHETKEIFESSSNASLVFTGRPKQTGKFSRIKQSAIEAESLNCVITFRSFPAPGRFRRQTNDRRKGSTVGDGSIVNVDPPVKTNFICNARTDTLSGISSSPGLFKSAVPPRKKENAECYARTV